MLLATKKWTTLNDFKTVKFAYISPVRYTLRNKRAGKTKNTKQFSEIILVVVWDFISETVLWMFW